jgi:hypothetical protein
VYVEGSSGPPPGSQPTGNCWVNNLVVTPNSAPVGHTFNFSGRGQCDGNARASRFTIGGSPYGESSLNTHSVTWSSEGRSTGNVRICFQITSGAWSNARESCTNITLTSAGTAPSNQTGQGGSSGNLPSQPTAQPPAQPPVQVQPTNPPPSTGGSGSIS